MSIPVHLTFAEINMGAAAGVWRQLQSISKGLREKKHCATKSGWDIGVAGAIGELAFAKAMGLYWGGQEGTFKGPDVGGFQVRTTFNPKGRLPWREGDSLDEMFVLVAGTPPDMEVVGWIIGHDAKRVGNHENPNGGGWAWFVNQDQLTPLNHPDDLAPPTPQARVASVAKQAQTEAAGAPAGPEATPPVQGDEPTPF